MPESCSECNDSGWVVVTCPTCEGSGFNPAIQTSSDFNDALWSELYCPSCNNAPSTSKEPCSCARGREWKRREGGY